MAGGLVMTGLAVAALLGSQGCAAIGLTLLSAGAGTAAGQGLSYTLDSIAYKTFTAPMPHLEAATLKTLERMDIPVKSSERSDAGVKLEARAGDRDIDIELERLTARTARMRVNAKINWFFRDRATAGEIIAQTVQTLDDEVRLAPASRPVVAQPARWPGRANK